MINPKNRIYKAFATALSGVTHNGDAIPIVTFPPPGKIPFYVQLGTITTVEEGCKDLFGHECTIDIQVISQYEGNYASPLSAEDIADQVTQLLKAETTSTLSIDDFDMVYIVLDNGFNDEGDIFATNRSYRTINQYRFLINEVVETPVSDWILFNGFWNQPLYWINDAYWID